MKAVSLPILTCLSLLLVLGIHSCIPGQKTSGKRKTSAPALGGEVPNTPGEPQFDRSEPFWRSGNINQGSTLTVNANSSTVFYLRGRSVHSFLQKDQNMSKVFCLVVTYNRASIADSLRLRAVPMNFPDHTSGIQERILRIDVPEKSLNSTICDGAALKITAEPRHARASNSGAYSLIDLCPTCRGTIGSTNVSLYQSVAGEIAVDQRVAEQELDLGILSLRVNTKSFKTNPNASCSQSDCTARGFDCCLDGECVHDGHERPSASRQPDYAEATAAVAQNPQSFVDWDHIYFVCRRQPPTPPHQSQDLPDAHARADALLQERIKEYQCLEEGKKEEPDFAGNSVCEPNFDEDSYKAVRAAVWYRCGCRADPLPEVPDDPVCPDFGLKVKRDPGTDRITEVACLIPPPPFQVELRQDLGFPVPTRSAPHRFFRRDTGEAVDNIFDYEDRVEAEGLPFSYLDDAAKTDPDNGKFNMNSLTGQFSLTLSQALPAKVFTVELSQSYVISTVEGTYTPCLQCSADSWFESFSAHPRSSWGSGLDAVGYSTNRSVFNDNTSFGNYEDTVFGRSCWLPPTMIPFSHKKKRESAAQRQARLETQAAFYVNGYQRDWFGFNKGALIGSFDGVSWFAIGKARRVISRTGKLFLAINQPFADLAEPEELVVQIIPDNGHNTAADFDYDPNLPPNHTNNQSAGAGCQYWHQCENDSDCISRLGWEYRCGDISAFKTRWPRFNADAGELADQEYEQANLARIIQGNLPTGSRKRCFTGVPGPFAKGTLPPSPLFNKSSLPAPQTFIVPNSVTGDTIHKW